MNRLAVDGETGTLEATFESYANSVYSFLLSRCGCVVVAEDLTAETFHAASRQFTLGRGHEVTRPWLFVVAKRRLVDHWRSEGARQRGIDRLKSEASRGPEDTGSRPEVSAVDVALASLPDRYRAALVLRYLEDFSVSEVADALCLSYKACESVLTRARKAFARSYESSGS